MRNSLRIFALLLLVPVGNAQNLPDARAFVQRIYAGYEYPASAREPDTLWKLAPSIFSAGLLHLIRQAQRADNGYALDADPVCDCQDFEGLKLLNVAVDRVHAAHTTASVTLQLFADAPTSTKSLRLSLIYTEKGWRIDDISTAETPSIRRLLQTDH